MELKLKYFKIILKWLSSHVATQLKFELYSLKSKFLIEKFGKSFDQASLISLILFIAIFVRDQSKLGTQVNSNGNKIHDEFKKFFDNHKKIKKNVK